MANSLAKFLFQGNFSDQSFAVKNWMPEILQYNTKSALQFFDYNTRTLEY